MSKLCKFYEPYKDMFNYYQLITKIDAGYKLYFDKFNKCFVILNSAKNNHMCLKFNNFSFDLLKKLQYTRIENSKILFDEIDNFNSYLEDKNNEKFKDEVIQKSIDFLNFSKRVSSIKSSDTKKIVEGKL